MDFQYLIRFKPDPKFTKQTPLFESDHPEIAFAVAYYFEDRGDEDCSLYLSALDNEGNKFSAIYTDAKLSYVREKGEVLSEDSEKLLQEVENYLYEELLVKNPEGFFETKIPRDDNYAPLSMASENFDPDFMTSPSNDWPFTLKFYA